MSRLAALKAMKGKAGELFKGSIAKAKQLRPEHAGDLASEVMIGARMKEIPELLKKHPFQATGWAAGGAVFAKELVVDPLREASEGMDLKEAIELDRRNRVGARLEVLRAEEKRRRSMESLARLAAMDPQLYNELTAGRVLPKGGVMFGGVPRTDILESVGGMMAEGEVTRRPDPDQEFMKLFGGL